jgi:hypothetical protein
MTAKATTEKEARRGTDIILAGESTGMERATIKVGLYLRNYEADLTFHLSFSGDHNKGGHDGKDHG